MTDSYLQIKKKNNWCGWDLAIGIFERSSGDSNVQ